MKNNNLTENWDDLINLVLGVVYLPDKRCSFEFIEELYKHMKPFLEIRRDRGIVEGAVLECDE